MNYYEKIKKDSREELSGEPFCPQCGVCGLEKLLSTERGREKLSDPVKRAEVCIKCRQKWLDKEVEI